MNGFRAVIAVAAIAFVSTNVSFAQESSSAWETRLRDGGVRVVSRTTRGERTSYILESSLGRFTLDAAGPVSSEAAASILALQTAISGWKSLVPGAVTFTAQGDDVRVRVVPATFAEGSRNFASYVPSGLVFSAMGGFIDYEFRVKVEAYFLRFRGRFSGERELLDRLASAIDDPAAFVKNNDPDYHFARTIEQEEALLALTSRVEELEKRSADQDRRLAAQDELLAAQGAKLALLEKAAIAIQGKTAAKPVNPAVISRVAALRAENAKTTAKEMVPILKAEGLTANVKQVGAILAILFGEY